MTGVMLAQLRLKPRWSFGVIGTELQPRGRISKPCRRKQRDPVIKESKIMEENRDPREINNPVGFRKQLIEAEALSHGGRVSIGSMTSGRQEFNMADSEPLADHERGRKRKYEPPTMRQISREEVMRRLGEADKSNPSKENEDFRRRLESVLSDKPEM
jgi:hypothetical protein